MDEVKYYERTYSLKTKDGKYAWIYNDGTERFPGVTFETPASAQEYVDKLFGRTLKPKSVVGYHKNDSAN